MQCGAHAAHKCIHCARVYLAQDHAWPRHARIVPSSPLRSPLPSPHRVSCIHDLRSSSTVHKPPSSPPSPSSHLALATVSIVAPLTRLVMVIRGQSSAQHSVSLFMPASCPPPARLFTPAFESLRAPRRAGSCRGAPWHRQRARSACGPSKSRQSRLCLDLARSRAHPCPACS